MTEAEQQELIAALETLCAVHLKAFEFNDWRVEMGAGFDYGNAAPWDVERYVPAWAKVREMVLKYHPR